MEWTRTSAGNPAVTNLLSLKSFLPTEVNEATTKTIVAQKPKTNLPEKVDPDSVPTAESIGQGSYQKYNQNQVNKLFSLVFSENQTAAAAARETGINVRTAQNYVRLAREKIQADFDAATVKTDKSNGLETMEVEEFFENKPDATLEQARIAVMEEFSGLQITKSAIQKHLVKKLEKLPEKRDNVNTIEMRRDRILEWQQLADFNYLLNCVFIDEAGFNMHIKRTFGRSVSGTPAKTTVPMQRGVSITILGAMRKRGIVSLSLKKPTAVATKKKRKLDIYTNVEVNGQIGTRTQHYLNFLSHTMDIGISEGLWVLKLRIQTPPFAYSVLKQSVDHEFNSHKRHINIYLFSLSILRRLVTCIYLKQCREYNQSSLSVHSLSIPPLSYVMTSIYTSEVAKRYLIAQGALYPRNHIIFTCSGGSSMNYVFEKDRGYSYRYSGVNSMGATYCKREKKSERLDSFFAQRHLFYDVVMQGIQSHQLNERKF
ncbi:Homeodomain-like DNA binding domain-containing transcription factor [Phycomyces blakesleeanus NRRL 1555(-)]|uniref:Homeodomain-like DNA binding domain-containing transcription factor n=1 Tax=Phycomyces blakesleeanus (strain ATCC 8743b / DSM 1359 / FGSC 10004 / NBRC 33097 / NRRL 1555) TaxID=763407 RepID=A0A162XMR9_PHYB8|nr:Homeodomain-like DNA binding domain-containing transcription factor [Phycomyces blakesleeanus NRRL 1555(-)]XP_018293775.1 Homeodomain-like DNA binding domain-containing transcription factor [Phycomyces blakesleeanus NRRL 1555(-)]XP_018296471.1 Homeodomain-like DNA binding domain-containing transcription factor [Phycomyces blakesleeanus NRRL 1555(-)]OAD65449.1 Homeodomain-like DNA binding domain-containing transcription factor [Phycomyces blakesleeanus NRRL 1555(-)]OAD75735.1 Homeodomain-like|eukprot:XP_018283489.1 Homeodomain-like DNA binding domain-containing transcription factor [Phycomyces blakesleeanus NRRL 1555(-)]